MSQPSSRAVGALYEAVLQELSNAEALLRHELAHADESKIRVREKNYDFLELLLRHPEYGPRDYRDVVSDYTSAERELRSNTLHTSTDRQRLSDLMRTTSASMVRLVMGASANSFQDYDAVAKVVLSRVFYERRLESKILLVALHSDGAWPVKDNESALSIIHSIKRIATQGSYKLCREVARRLVGQLGTSYGFEKKQSRTELMQGTLEDISSSRDIDDLRMTLLFVQQDLRTLREESEAEIQNKVDAFVKSFFTSMNSADRSHLLDTAASILAEINDPGSTVNKSHEACRQTLELLVTMYSNLLNTYEVNAMHQVGTTLTIPWNELSSFLVTNVRKQEGAPPDSISVRATVRTPGWKFKGEVLSRPTVEVIGDTTQ